MGVEYVEFSPPTTEDCPAVVSPGSAIKYRVVLSSLLHAQISDFHVKVLIDGETILFLQRFRKRDDWVELIHCTDEPDDEDFPQDERAKRTLQGRFFLPRDAFSSGSSSMTQSP